MSVVDDDTKGVPFGKVNYRSRMRKPLDNALKWNKAAIDVFNKDFDQSKLDNLKGLAAPKPGLKDKKIFRIQVRSCKGLKRENDASFDPRLMQPFFHYYFYKFDHSSAIASGDSPVFDFEHKYELENSRDLDDYMKHQILIINFLDKSVDFGEVTQLDNLKDYIGSVRIPLRDLATGAIKSIEDDHFPIKNHLNKTMGTAAIKISFTNADSAEEVIAVADERNRLH